jgi:hypothetical protein
VVSGHTALAHGASRAGLAGIYGTGAGAPLDAGATRLVDANLRNGCADGREVPLALAK